MKPPDEPIDLETRRKKSPEMPYMTEREWDIAIITANLEASRYFRRTMLIAYGTILFLLLVILFFVTKKPSTIIIYRDGASNPHVFSKSLDVRNDTSSRTKNLNLSPGAARDR